MALEDYLVRPIGANICFDCKKACGGCSWSELDPKTGKPRFEPVPGWTAKKVMLNTCHTKRGKHWEPTYSIKACPLFEPDDPREIDRRALTYTENLNFLENIESILRRWASG